MDLGLSWALDYPASPSRTGIEVGHEQGEEIAMILLRGLGISTASSDFAVVNRLMKLTSTVDLTGKTVLDIGCNDASYTVEFAQSARSVIGIDLREECLSSAYSRVKGQTRLVWLLMMNAERLAFPDESFDVVVMNEVLEHIPDQARALDEVCRVLKKNGVFVLFVPNRLYVVETHGAHIGQRKLGRFIPFIHWLPRSIGRNFMNARSYTESELRQLLACHGFAVIHSSCLFPPLDGLRCSLKHLNLTGIVDNYRNLIPLMAQAPILRLMGLSIFVVAAKSGRACDEYDIG
jgi:ubiquinone/menaquinone biosynthesis C-methylase UbiE